VRFLGEALVEMRVLDEEKLAQALSEQRTEGRHKLICLIIEPRRRRSLVAHYREYWWC